MAKLPNKSALLAHFEDAVRLSGWDLLYVAKGKQPAHYKIFRNENNETVRVFIWNITHGGKGRRADEYRIQITGLTDLAPKAGSKTLILGWWNAIGIFTGWDIRQHTGSVSSSPSMQVSEGALRQAMLTGFAPYVNQKSETAVAFRPDFIGTYIQFLEQLHDSGKVPKEAALLTKISEDANNVPDEEIGGGVAQKRQYAVLSTKRAIRALDFSRRVLGAYGHRCAMCDTQLRLVDGAHILPAAHEDSTDHTSNGVALCAIHHRAYDRGLVTFDSKLKVGINDKMVKALKADDRVGGLKTFRENLRPFLSVPADKKDWPSGSFIKAANTLRGWDLK